MGEWKTPRATVEALLRGEACHPPLLMPILFSVGARMENVSLQDFHKNPTKIANALRQVRNALKVDGLTCYFDRFLEVDALGCRREWSRDGSCQLVVPAYSDVTDLREKLTSPDALADKGAIPVACEVLRRLKGLLKDEPALSIRVTGPFSLARQLNPDLGTLVDGHEATNQDLVEFAAEVTASVSRTFVESGADVIFLTENFGFEISLAQSQWYGSLLAPIVNIARFYAALPVLLLGLASDQTLASLAANLPECVLCPTLTTDLQQNRVFLSQLESHSFGCALPLESFDRNTASVESLLLSLAEASRRNCCIVASSDDGSSTMDMKLLAEGLNRIRQRLRSGSSQSQ